MTQNNTEIERKFLIELHSINPSSFQGAEITDIRQAYLTEGSMEIRVRETSQKTRTKQFFMTIKKAISKMSRKEIEFHILETTFEDLWQLTILKLKLLIAIDLQM